MDADITFRSEQRLTPDEFFAWVQRRSASDIQHYELIHGRIVMTPPAGFLHGTIGARLCRIIGNHVESLHLGRVLDASAGYDLPSGDTLEPDVSFVSAERLAAGPQPDDERFARVVPDLVVEILSRSTAQRDRTEKKAIYATNGVREYWIVDPRRRAVTVFRSDGQTFAAGRGFTAGPVASAVLPGLNLDVGELFA